MKHVAFPVAVVCGLLLVGFSAADSLSPRPELEKQVADLVRQLGDDDFQRREAAQQTLLRLGADIVPLLDKLPAPDDVEVQARLRHILHELVGYREDIRDALAAQPEITGDVHPPLPENLKQDILGNQPKAGDFLLSLLAEPKAPLHRRAVNAVVQTWDSMTVVQVETYLRHMLVLEARPRQRYPQGFEAYVSMGYYCRYGWGGWPGDEKMPFTTRTRHLLDGKPYGKDYAYQGPLARTGYINTKELSLGEHLCALELEYEFTHRGAKHRGRLRSEPFAFTMVAADAPDDLVAPADEGIERTVRKALHFAEKEADVNPPAAPLRTLPILPTSGTKRRPQITWEGTGGKCCGLATVYWGVAEALPVDLCFEATLVEQKTGKAWPCDPLVLPRGAVQWGYVVPRDAQGFARGRTGDVAVKVVLKSSRKTALSSPEISHYFSGPFTSEVLTVRVFEDYRETDLLSDDR